MVPMNQTVLRAKTVGWVHESTTNLEADLAQEVVVLADVGEGQRRQRGQVLADALAAVPPVCAAQPNAF